MKPRPIDTIHTTREGLPTVAATAPMENSTSGGTPLATQKAPVQSMPRSSPDALGCAALPAAGRSFAVLLKLPPTGWMEKARTDSATAPRGSLRIWPAGGVVAAIDREVGTGHV